MKHLIKARKPRQPSAKQRKLFEEIKEKMVNLKLQMCLLSELKEFEQEFEYENMTHCKALGGPLRKEYYQEIQRIGMDFI